MLKELFYFFIYPGLLFAGIVGGLLSWFDRKITAWVQFRQGPPLLQPFYDFLKLLLVKETILPARGSKITFLLTPIFSLFGATISGVLILLPAMGMISGFGGDLIVIFYLLTIPSLTYIIGALASGNPFASGYNKNSENPVIEFDSFLDDVPIALEIRDKDINIGLGNCDGAGTGLPGCCKSEQQLLDISLPLPEWQEISPSF